MDPFTLLLACWFAWLVVRDGGPILSESRGLVPHSANNRHAERMQRMQHAHEKWMSRNADRRSLRENPSLLRQAVDERLAGWVRNAGRRQDKVTDKRRTAETSEASTGRTAGAWRTAWRDAREYMAAWWRYMAERAEQRFSTRPPIVTDIHLDDEPPQAESSGPQPADEPGPAATAGTEPDNDHAATPKYAQSVRLDEPKALEAAAEPDLVVDAEVVDEPETPAAPEAEEPPSNVIPINRGERHMSDSQVLTLGSGETINPETGVAFAEGLSAIYTEMGSRIQASIANLSGANVADDQIAKLTEMLNLNSAAQAKAEEMKGHFTDHQQAQAVVASTGAGTNNGYLA